MGSNSGLLMAVLGVIFVVHGVVLLTLYASRLDHASGLLMIGYSLVMILNQTLVGVTDSANWGMGMKTGMDGGMGRYGIYHDRRDGVGPRNGRARSSDVD